MCEGAATMWADWAVVGCSRCGWVDGMRGSGRSSCCDMEEDQEHRSDSLRAQAVDLVVFKRKLSILLTVSPTRKCFVYTPLHNVSRGLIHTEQGVMALVSYCTLSNSASPES